MNKFIVVGLLLVVGVYWYQSQPDTLKNEASTATERIESTLPAEPPIGIESSARLIYTTTSSNGTTAAGQIFSPTSQTPILFKASFLTQNNNHSGLGPQGKFQLILSEWLVDRPAPTPMWVSEPRLPSISHDSRSIWQDFNIPHILLDPSKEYIAWITLSELQNPARANIAIHYMGRRYSAKGHQIPYAEGRSAFFQEPNPDGRRGHMTGSAWQTQDFGHNLHFKMSFTNRE